jgi:hypothetical protein
VQVAIAAPGFKCNYPRNACAFCMWLPLEPAMLSQSGNQGRAALWQRAPTGALIENVNLYGRN